MRRLLVILTLLISSLSLRAEEVNVSEILFGHIGDSYGWHITEFNGNHVIIPLPCIVRSSTGWHFFMSSKLEHGHEYEGLFIAEEGRYADKIVERGPDGEYTRPFDISITKNVASLMFSSALLVLLVLLSARWYRRHDASEEAPGGIAAALEPLIMVVNEELIKENVGPDYKRYSPYLLTKLPVATKRQITSRPLPPCALPKHSASKTSIVALSISALT